MKYIAYGIEPEKADDELIRRIEKLATEYEVIAGSTIDDFADKIDKIEIAFRSVDTETLIAMQQLRWFQAWSAGVDHLLEDQRIAESPVMLTNASGIHPVPMAEHIFSLLLSLSRGLYFAAAFREQRLWKRVPVLRLFELEGKTMLILGAGSVGRRTATLAKAFGMRVIAARRSNLDRLGPFDEVVPWEAFREYLPDTDVLVNILPLTPETEGLLDTTVFDRLGPHAIFINVGRGKTVDQYALEAALREGRIGGAGLDVVDPEPLPPDSDLWTMENVILTGHYAGITPRYEERGNEIFLQNLSRYLENKELFNLVDRKRGY